MNSLFCIRKIICNEKVIHPPRINGPLGLAQSSFWTAKTNQFAFTTIEMIELLPAILTERVRDDAFQDFGWSEERDGFIERQAELANPQYFPFNHALTLI